MRNLIVILLPLFFIPVSGCIKAFPTVEDLKKVNHLTPQQYAERQFDKVINASANNHVTIYKLYIAKYGNLLPVPGHNMNTFCLAKGGTPIKIKVYSGDPFAVVLTPQELANAAWLAGEPAAMVSYRYESALRGNARVDWEMARSKFEEAREFFGWFACQNGNKDAWKYAILPVGYNFVGEPGSMASGHEITTAISIIQ